MKARNALDLHSGSVLIQIWIQMLWYDLVLDLINSPQVMAFAWLYYNALSKCCNENTAQNLEMRLINQTLQYGQNNYNINFGNIQKKQAEKGA